MYDIAWFVKVTDGKTNKRDIATTQTNHLPLACIICLCDKNWTCHRYISQMQVAYHGNRSRSDAPTWLWHDEDGRVTPEAPGEQLRWLHTTCLHCQATCSLTYITGHFYFRFEDFTVQVSDSLEHQKISQENGKSRALQSHDTMVIFIQRYSIIRR